MFFSLHYVGYWKKYVPRRTSSLFCFARCNRSDLMYVYLLRICVYIIFFEGRVFICPGTWTCHLYYSVEWNLMCWLTVAEFCVRAVDRVCNPIAIALIFRMLATSCKLEETVNNNETSGMVTKYRINMKLQRKQNGLWQSKKREPGVIAEEYIYLFVPFFFFRCQRIDT